ncbi:origin recognition complex subunit 6 [Cylas formicarius]|uniref:origin recognition complex subunit 6 n=1 Tax=Cylas formicarius TaxID=197179 RepID=UPI0029587867|nr:origin recognition complex subunit 6 [Cylas formicarius]
MNRAVLQNAALKLNIVDETILRSAEECLRSYHNKCSIKGINDQAKTVLCLDIATQNCGALIDKETAYKLSGLKKSVYEKNYNSIQTLLGLETALTVANVCVFLGCAEVKDIAEEILSNYLKHDKKIKDLNHPQYAVAATYLACRLRKINIDKHQLHSLSRLKPSQFKALVTELEPFIPEKHSLKKRRNTKTVQQEDPIIDLDGSAVSEMSEEIEEYEVWRDRILREAYAALEDEHETMEQ